MGMIAREYPGTITWISDKSEFTPKGIQTKDERAKFGICHQDRRPQRWLSEDRAIWGD